MEGTVSDLLMLEKISIKSAQIKDYIMCFGNILKFFSVDFNPIDINNILDIHRYLMKGK